MKSLNEDLKTGQLKQIYLLYGEEAYLKKQYKDKLHYAIVPSDDTMNYAYYEGKGINAKEGSWNSDGRMRRQFFGGLRGV